MISFLVLLLFFFYSFVIFIIQQLWILGVIFLYNTILSLILKVSIKKRLFFLKKSLLFVLFIILCNMIFLDLEEAIKVGLQLLLVIDYTYLMGTYFNPTRIRTAFRIFFFPLKIFRVDIDSITLIISISLSFIPILMDEARVIQMALKSKGFAFSLRNVIAKPHIFLITFINNLLDRLDELEKSLELKAY